MHVLYRYLKALFIEAWCTGLTASVRLCMVASMAAACTAACDPLGTDSFAAGASAVSEAGLPVNINCAALKIATTSGSNLAGYRMPASSRQGRSGLRSWLRKQRWSCVAGHLQEQVSIKAPQRTLQHAKRHCTALAACRTAFDTHQRCRCAVIASKIPKQIHSQQPDLLSL